MEKVETTLPITLSDLRALVVRIESDWGHEYAIDDGTNALRELRRLVGGEPDSNMGQE